MTRLSVACGLIWMLFVVSTTDAYSKYGRSCKDIGCRSNEVCVMEEEPCTIYKRDNCGRYPTCKKSSEAGEQTCTTMICPAGQYCKTENGRPTCVNTMPGLGYESAGISSVNGQKIDGGNTNVNNNNNGGNINPFANANAPPAPPSDNDDAYHSMNHGTNLGYPPYPNSNPNNNNNNNNRNVGGYPGFGQQPSSGQQPPRDSLGYPPYPTQNRMPIPGQTYPGGAGYPPQQGGGYPQQQYPVNGYPQQYPANGQRYPAAGQYPGYQNYPYPNPKGHNSYNTNSIYRRNSSSFVTPSIMLVAILSFALCRF